ncbi:MAG: putative bifunctional diguanylate cyclase/phosphodiesterase, partial [Gammaproteobacteria bacterium]
GDELEQLGSAFNGMAERLRRNADFQSVLAAIDRDALNSHDPASTVAALLRGLGRLVRLDWACVWFHDGRANRFLMMVQDAPDAAPRTLSMRELSVAERVQLLSADGWHEVPAELAAARSADGRVIETVYAVPLTVDSRAEAAVWIAPPRGLAFTAADEHLLRELAARLGVALVSFAAQEELFREAHFDTLTGLPNRRFFRDMLEAALARASCDAHCIGLLFVDLDDFKYVNDSLGHVTGDKLLKSVAGTLKRTTREGDLVARLGGDEFVVVLNGLPADEAAASSQVSLIAEKIIAELRRPVTLDGLDLLVRASIGGALHPRDGATTDELLRAADAAMYSAKEAARGGFAFFSQAMKAQATHRVALLAELVRGVEREEFVLHYQPQVSTTDGSVIGCEALLRWQHPTRGLLGPGEFLAEAEATGLIGEIGASVLRRATRQLAAWHELGFTELSMSVNVSARQFDDPHLVTMVSNLLEDVGIPASTVELEITESVACRRLDHTIDIMSQLSALGVRLAIDDFGTGHSSLSYLQRMPLHTLKVDRSFVVEIGVSRRGESIVDAVLALGKCLSLDIVAEGVETPAQYAYLAERGCDLIQGWLYRPALPPLKFLEYVIERRALARETAAKAMPRALREAAD